MIDKQLKQIAIVLVPIVVVGIISAVMAYSALSQRVDDHIAEYQRGLEDYDDRLERIEEHFLEYVKEDAH